jgi:hypothetical protein
LRSGCFPSLKEIKHHKGYKNRPGNEPNQKKQEAGSEKEKKSNGFGTMPTPKER